MKTNTLCILFAVVLIVIVDNIDVTAVNVALPTIMQQFNLSIHTTNLIAYSYITSSAAFFVFAGYIGEKYGTRLTLLAGIILFFAASFAIGISNSINIIIFARFVQGCGYAFTFTMVFLIIREYIAEQYQKMAISFIVAIAAISSFAGPIIGGLIVNYFSWQWIFLINLPLGALILLIIYKYINKSHNYLPISSCEIFFLSMFVLMIILFMLTIYFTSNILLTTTIIIVIIILYNKKYYTNIISFNDLLHKPMVLVLLNRFVIQAVFAGLLILAPFFLEKVVGMNVVKCAYYIAIITFSLALISFIISFFAEKINTKIMIIIGFLILILANTVYIYYTYNKTDTILIISFVLYGISLGILYPQVNIQFIEVLNNRDNKSLSTGLYYTLSAIFSATGIFVVNISLENSYLSSAKTCNRTYIELLIFWSIISLFAICSNFYKKDVAKNIN